MGGDMRVFVTGASGFVGSVLARRLAMEGITVHGTYRDSVPPPTGAIEWLRLALPEVEENLVGVLRDCDCVVHLAALAHQQGQAGVGRWKEFEAINMEGTRALALASRAAGVRRFIFMSSVAAICSRSAVPVSESTPPRPDSDYGRSKLAAERALEAALSGGATDWCILRPPLVYGPGNPGNMQRLMQLLATGLPLPLASIRNQRSFMFVDNLADAILTTIRREPPIRGTYLICDDSHFATPELVAALAAAMGRRPRLLPMPIGALKLLGRVGDALERSLGLRLGMDSYSVERLIGSLRVDSARFRESLGWRPPVDRDTAVGLTCKATMTAGRQA